eukprot:5696110-Prymnesium_polylepis.1
MIHVSTDDRHDDTRSYTMTRDDTCAEMYHLEITPLSIGNYTPNPPLSASTSGVFGGCFNFGNATSARRLGWGGRYGAPGGSQSPDGLDWPLGRVSLRPSPKPRWGWVRGRRPQ